MRAVAVLLLLAPCAWASEADMHSSACRDALAALRARATAIAPAASPASGRPPAADDATWRALRAKAARVCLGGAPDALPPRGATSPEVVPPVTTASPAAPAPAARAAPPPARTLPPLVTLCDGAYCWTSDGERLPQVGRSPFDPRVQCSVQGRVVVCR